MSKKPTKRQPSLESRKSALRELTNQIGVYVLRNLDRAPIYGNLEKLPARPNRDLEGENAYESKRERTRIIRRQFRGS